MYTKPIQHGEMILKPVKTVPKGSSSNVVDVYVGSFSKAGHHHVINSKGMIVVEKGEKRYVVVTNEGTITHHKEHDRHPDLPLPAGNYQINIKTEYDIFNDVISAVQD